MTPPTPAEPADAVALRAQPVNAEQAIAAARAELAARLAAEAGATLPAADARPANPPSLAVAVPSCVAQAGTATSANEVADAALGQRLKTDQAGVTPAWWPASQSRMDAFQRPSAPPCAEDNLGSPAEPWPHPVELYAMNLDQLVVLGRRMQADQTGLTQELIDQLEACLRTYQPAPPPPPRPAAPTRPPPATPLPFEPITIPPDRSNDPEPVLRAKRSLRYQLDTLPRRVRVEARLGSPDPMMFALYDLEGHNAPLARYLIAVRAGRVDLAADFLAEAAAEYRIQPAVFDQILGDLVTPELKAAAAPPPPSPPPPAPAPTPAPAPAPAPAATSAAPGTPAPPAGKPLTHLHGWIIPTDVVTAWAISPRAAKMIMDRSDADYEKARADAGAAGASAEFRRRCLAGEAVGFAGDDGRVPRVLALRRRDLQEGRKTPVPMELREQVRARRAELLAEYLERKEQQERKRKREAKARRKKTSTGKSMAPSAVKLLGLNQFMDALVEHGVSAPALAVWVHLWRWEWDGLVETTDRVMAKHLPYSRPTIETGRKELIKKGFLVVEKKGRQGKASQLVFNT